MKEVDLFLVISDYYKKLGYEVDGEVGDIDLLAKINENFIAIEIKLTISLKLILQAVDRQRFFENVYIAVPAKFVKKRNTTYYDKLRLLKRLGIGLIGVDLINQDLIYISHPLEADIGQIRKKNKKTRERLIDEFNKRQIKSNLGGGKGKVLTQYKENAYIVLHFLYNSKGHISGAKALIESGAPKNTNQIMYKNYYGWFERISHGKYGLSQKGIDEYLEKKVMVKKILEKQSKLN